MANERKQENRVLANREIRSKEVRLINADGNNIGIVPIFRAMSIAQDQELDLILINPQAHPPVCKVADLGKYKYDLQKRQKEADRRSRESRIDTKEVQLRPGIDRHDLDIKIKRIKEWLDDGDKVKIVIRFRGREIANSDNASTIIDDILSHVPDARLEGNSELQGNRLTATLFQGKQKNEQKA
jgi:translation initiation factor IF-3